MSIEVVVVVGGLFQTDFNCGIAADLASISVGRKTVNCGLSSMKAQ